MAIPILVFSAFDARTAKKNVSFRTRVKLVACAPAVVRSEHSFGPSTWWRKFYPRSPTLLSCSLSRRCFGPTSSLITGSMAIFAGLHIRDSDFNSSAWLYDDDHPAVIFVLVAVDEGNIERQQPSIPM